MHEDNVLNTFEHRSKKLVMLVLFPGGSFSFERGVGFVHFTTILSYCISEYE